MNEMLKYLRRVLSQRRTVKPDQYTGALIDDNFVRMILEEANWAPTHGHTEPWRFVVFKGGGLKRLGQFLAEQDQPDPQAEDFNAQRFERLRDRPSRASHVIGIGMHPGGNPKVPEIEELCATAMAVQNMWLMAHALGLGAYWSTGPMAFTEATREFMGWPAGDRSLGFFYLGVPDSRERRGHRLSGIDEKLRWVTE